MFRHVGPHRGSADDVVVVVARSSLEDHGCPNARFSSDSPMCVKIERLRCGASGLNYRDFVSSQSAIKTHQHGRSRIPDADSGKEYEHSRLCRTLAVGG